MRLARLTPLLFILLVASISVFSFSPSTTKKDKSLTDQQLAHGDYSLQIIKVAKTTNRVIPWYDIRVEKVIAP